MASVTTEDIRKAMRDLQSPRCTKEVERDGKKVRCGKPIYARQMCVSHYNRWLRYER